MKKLGMLVLTVMLSSSVFGATFEGDVVDRQPVASTFTKVIDLQGLKRVSMQAVYSKANAPARNVQIGGRTYVNFLVADWTKIQGRASTATLTLVNGKNTSAALSGLTIGVNGKNLVEGTHWARGASSTNTMAGLAICLSSSTEYRASASSNVITLTALSTGAYANAWTLTTSSPAAISSGSWSNGNEPGYININGTTLTEGSSFLALVSTVTTARNISAAINSNSALATVVMSTHVQGVVYATSTTNGVFNYPISLSAGGGFGSPSPSPYFSGVSTPSFVSVEFDTIAQTNHGYATGQGVMVTTTGVNALPGGLVTQTTYYVILIDSNTFKLAASANAALTGTAVDLTSTTLTLTPSTFTVTPMPFVLGDASGKWQASNDGANWTDLSVSSVTNTQVNSGGNSLWDFGEFAYRYLRWNVLGPSAGAVNWRIRQYGKDQ